MRHLAALLCAGLLCAAWPQAPASAAARGPERADAMRAALAQAIGLKVPEGEPWKCGLPLITRALSLRNTLPPEAASVLAKILDRPVTQTQRTKGHFTVHYDTSGPAAASLLGPDRRPLVPDSSNAFADSVLAIANQVYTYETGTLGYAAPPADGTSGGGPEYDIYVVNLGSEYGETTPEDQLDTKPDGGKYTSYIDIDNDFAFVKPDSNVGLPALRVTIAHEFHHAIQLGSYGYWSSQLYFHELSSVWMETMAFPRVTDNLNYLRASWGEFHNPDVEFTSNGPIMYSRGIWGTYLTKRFTPVIMREIWEDIQTDAPLLANDVVLKRHSSSFREAFAEWTLWNYFTGRRADTVLYYPRGSVYPAVVAAGIDFPASAPPRSVSGELHPLSARYHEIATGSDTCCLVIANVNDATALDASPPLYPYTVNLDKGKTDDSYQPVGTAGYYSLSVADAGNWKTWAVQGHAVVRALEAEGVPYPNPFRADGSRSVSFPAHGSSAMVRVYDSAMRLVYEAFQNATPLPDKTVFRWDGRNNDGRLAASGVYFFTLEIADGATITGKVALLRTGP